MAETMLEGKTVLLAVTGGIAAYKMPDVARRLKKLHANVHVLMTENAANFVTATTFETLTGNKCVTDTFDRNFEFSVEHVALAKQAQLVLIAPATANVIGKIANGIADDMLTTTVMACTCPVLIAPAMNHNMYHNPIVQENLGKLRRHGYKIIEPERGMLANGDVGDGRLADAETLMEYVKMALAFPKDMAGLKVLVTAGPTREAVDPVRFLTNHSTGKMGYAVARVAAYRGADVTLVAGPTSLKPPLSVHTFPVVSAREMYEVVMRQADGQDIIIGAAAVADYRPACAATEKLKKTGQDTVWRMERTDDILACLGNADLGNAESASGTAANAANSSAANANGNAASADVNAANASGSGARVSGTALNGNGRKRERPLLCGFSMETEHSLERAREKLAKKNLDMIAANSLREEGAGFGTDTNVLTLITAREEKPLGLMSKEEAAGRLLDELLSLLALRAGAPSRVAFRP